MTYCVAIIVDAGLVFCSDSRTNAGINQISTYSKMYRYGIDDQRQFVILSAGNLATTQAVIARLKKDIKELAPVNLGNVATIGDAADYLGEINLAEQEKHNNGNIATFEASFILGGQIFGEKPQLMMVYPQGNHITTSKDTPYLQIGESKYGKPILDRILQPQTPMKTAALCALVSMDSTMRSNLTVGPPIELMAYHTDSFMLNHNRFNDDDEYLRELKRCWDARIAEAFLQLPPVNWPQQNAAGYIENF